VWIFCTSYFNFDRIIVKVYQLLEFSRIPKSFLVLNTTASNCLPLCIGFKSPSSATCRTRALTLFIIIRRRRIRIRSLLLILFVIASAAFRISFIISTRRFGCSCRPRRKRKFIHHNANFTHQVIVNASVNTCSISWACSSSAGIAIFGKDFFRSH